MELWEFFVFITKQREKNLNIDKIIQAMLGYTKLNMYYA